MGAIDPACQSRWCYRYRFLLFIPGRNLLLPFATAAWHRHRASVFTVVFAAGLRPRRRAHDDCGAARRSDVFDPRQFAGVIRGSTFTTRRCW